MTPRLSGHFSTLGLVFFVLKALFTRTEGNLSDRVTLALEYFFFFHTTCLEGRYGYPSARVTLPHC